MSLEPLMMRCQGCETDVPYDGIWMCKKCKEEWHDAATKEKEILTICLCGSTRFRDEFTEANRKFTMEGLFVLAPGVFAHSGDALTELDKEELDKLHFAKIDQSHKVFVVNVDGYIGESTASEIEYAKSLNKEIIYLESTT